MKELRQKSVLLTGYLELLLNQHLTSAENDKSHVNGGTLKSPGMYIHIFNILYMYVSTQAKYTV